MDLTTALKIAEVCEDEGIISTAAIALRTLSKAYREAQTELDALIYERDKHIPQLLKELKT